MKNFLLMAVLAMASAPQMRAQPVSFPPIASETEQHDKSPADRAAKDADRAEKQLGLNADQKAKWREASLVRINANAPLKEKMRASADESEKRSLGLQMRDNGKKFDETVNGFLTADQKVKWVQVKQERKSARKNRKHPSSVQPEPTK
jgi:hypothetical protein